MFTLSNMEMLSVMIVHITCETFPESMCTQTGDPLLATCVSYTARLRTNNGLLN